MRLKDDLFNLKGVLNILNDENAIYFEEGTSQQENAWF